jgi:hypothetical protein
MRRSCAAATAIRTLQMLARQGTILHSRFTSLANPR